MSNISMLALGSLCLVIFQASENNLTIVEAVLQICWMFKTRPYTFVRPSCRGKERFGRAQNSWLGILPTDILLAIFVRPSISSYLLQLLETP
jgi:hypothetical protein